MMYDALGTFGLLQQRRDASLRSEPVPRVFIGAPEAGTLSIGLNDAGRWRY